MAFLRISYEFYVTIKLHGNSKQAKSEYIYTQASSPKI